MGIERRRCRVDGLSGRGVEQEVKEGEKNAYILW